jgi:putative glycosyltransferase (TIGR04372 family)
MLNKHVWKRFSIVLKTRDYSAMRRAIIYVVFRFLGRLCALPTILTLYILKPFFWLKLGNLHASRLGHLSLNTDLFLRRRQLGIYPDGFHYFFFSNPYKLANRQLLTMFKRVLNIYESRILSLMFSGMEPLLKRTPFYQGLPMDSNEYYEFNSAKSSLYFTPDEIDKGRKLLKLMNMDFDKEEYVCIFARDESYMKQHLPYRDMSYHDSRNTDINNLIEASKYLIEKGFTIIRVGSVVNKPINFSHKKMIDYPYSEHQSEFLDIFIMAHCKFIVSLAPSGCTDISTIFDKPMLIVDFSDYGVAPLKKTSLYTLKKYKFRNSNNYLRFEDGLKLGYFWYNLPEFDLEAEEINSQDILEATKEMLDRLEGKFNYSPESEKLINAYYKLIEELDFRGSSMKTPIAINWLTKNQDLFF